MINALVINFELDKNCDGKPVINQLQQCSQILARECVCSIIS